jgi:hypothetical protein
MKTKQEIFDVVAKHLLTQKAQARTLVEYGSLGECAYRTGDGMRCAIGALINDADYDPTIEGLTVSNLRTLSRLKWSNHESGFVARATLFRDMLIKAGVDVTDRNTVRLMEDLQEVHDAGKVDSWVLALNEVARYHGLDNAVTESRDNE